MTLVAALSAFLVVALGHPSSAVDGPTLFAAHPSIVSKVDVGKRIKDLAVHDGRLYMGSGNYGVNTGPTDVAWVDLATGVTGVDATAPTEEINTYRTVGSDLLVPWVDPTLCGYCNPAGSGGFTSSDPTWHDTFAFPAAHVFDVAKFSSDWFLAGAGAYDIDGAVIYRSTDGGQTWKLSIAQASSGGVTGWERFYWMGTAGGKLYAQAAHKNYSDGCGCSSGDLFPLRAWDGTRWSKVRGSLGLITEASNVESFKGRIYTSRGQVFDGKRVTSMGAPFGVADFYVTTDRLYVVSSTGQVAHTTGSGWTLLPGAGVPSGVTATSLAVVGSSVYVATTVGTVYRSTL